MSTDSAKCIEAQAAMATAAVSRMLRVRIFPAERHARGHSELQADREEVTERAMKKYEAWLGRNILSQLEVVEIQVDNGTSNVPATAGWYPLLRCIIVVKYYGNDIP